MNEVVEILREARDVLADEGKWCKNGEGQTAMRSFVNALDPRAVAWCSVGAVRHVLGRRGLSINGEEYTRAVDTLNMAVMKRIYDADTEDSPEDIIDLNDHEATTHKALMDVWDYAIKRADDPAS